MKDYFFETTTTEESIIKISANSPEEAENLLMHSEGELISKDHKEVRVKLVFNPEGI